jgi:hypothetical protein
MIRLKVERSPFLNGLGFYVSKKCYNLYGNNKWWYGPSIAIHLTKKIVRLSWVIKKGNQPV